MSIGERCQCQMDSLMWAAELTLSLWAGLEKTQYSITLKRTHAEKCVCMHTVQLIHMLMSHNATVQLKLLHMVQAVANRM